MKRAHWGGLFTRTYSQTSLLNVLPILYRLTTEGGNLKTGKCVIKVYLDPDEKRRIEENAKGAGMSLSAYARTLALGNAPVTKVELDEISSVMKIHADLGRLGGLLKMTLTNDERLDDIGREMGVTTIDGTLVDIRATQAKLLELVDVVLRKAKG